MDTSQLSPGTHEVVSDLQSERGLSEWQIVRGVRVSVDSDECIDVIYGHALTTRLQEERIDRKRKQKAGKGTNNSEQPQWSCFLVLPAVSRVPTLSIKRLLELQDVADTNEPLRTVPTASKRTFLCLTDASNISYYALQAPAMLPSIPSQQ